MEDIFKMMLHQSLPLHPSLRNEVDPLDGLGKGNQHDTWR